MVTCYLIRDTYKFLKNIEHHDRSIFSDIIWHNKVPLKVSLYS